MFASGVSDSTCSSLIEFKREERVLSKALMDFSQARLFVYFGTCGVYDPTMTETSYVKHKVAMEQIVLSQPNGLVVRLPQVGGPGGNHRNLMHYLCESIVAGREFDLWRHAYRNVIDVDDVVSIVRCIVMKTDMIGQIVNVASSITMPVSHIVQAIERLSGKSAKVNAVDRGSPYSINISKIQGVLDDVGVVFDACYLDRVLLKYYL